MHIPLRSRTMEKSGFGKGERRRNPRTPLDDTALIIVLTEGTDVLERASVLDISPRGICFSRVEPLKGFAKDRFLINTDHPAMAYFKNHPLTLYGTVCRVDEAAGSLAMQVKRTTDEDLWHALCGA